MAGTKQKHNAVAAHERLGESVKSGVDTLRKSTTAEATASGKTFLKQLLGLEVGGDKKSKDAHGAAPQPEVKQPEKKFTTSGVEIIDLIIFNPSSSEKKPSAEKPAPRIEAAMNYSGEIAKSSEHAVKSENQEIRRDVQEIKAELQKLLQSSKVLEMEFAEVAMENTPVDAGEYHKTFFEWMLIVIRQARQKVEDSGSWLKTMKGKGGKAKTDYSVANGQMHQSGERTTIQNAVG